MKLLARIALGLLLAFPALGIAQIAPFFEFTLYFEDAIGNKDSIVLGHDPNASTQNINPQFGEFELINAFDSVFEVRVLRLDDPANRTLKKLIVDYDTINHCVIDIPARIIVNARFPPVKINYDSTVFPVETCGNVVLSPEWNLFTYQEWWDVNEYHCMSGASAFIEDFEHPTGWNFLFVDKEVEGQGIQQLPGLFFATFSGPGPCNDPTFIAVNDAGEKSHDTLYPNPAGGFVSIRRPLSDIQRVFIRDISGRTIPCRFDAIGEVVQIDVKSLMPGIYFVSVQTVGGKQAVYRFVKG